MMRTSYSMFFFLLCFAFSHHQVTSNNQHEDNSKEGYTLELNPAYLSSRVIPGSVSASKQPRHDHHSHGEKLHHHHHHHHVYYVEKASGYFPIKATSSYGQHRRRHHKRSHHQAQILKVQFPSKSLEVTYPALYEHNHQHKRPRHHVSIPMKGPQFPSESAVATPNRKESHRRHLYHYQHHRHHHHHHHRHQHKHKQSQHKHHSPSPGRLHNFS
ncbi:uncharacterized protein LOC104898331 [Beta vulgaris subsp. vulgaris]|uniref:uncharacterized protein LOC104898331 n=1 Tax=Beta vulgaris subsp. vulgaris TaxID=3555 RepID=UPI0020374767|nr:uncharacterized protein LOC104898331 [Beta vulgaris subsp. vulgaris]